MEQRELLKTWQFLDHRRLEEDFLLYGAIEVVMKYKMRFDNIALKRNSLVEMVVEGYHKVFYDKWTGKDFKVSLILLNMLNMQSKHKTVTCICEHLCASIRFYDQTDNF